MSLVIAVLALCAGILPAAQEWIIFADTRLTPDMAENLQSAGDRLTLKDGTVLAGRKVQTVRPLQKIRLEKAVPAIAAARIMSETEQLRTFGVSADFYRLYFNGALAADAFRPANDASRLPLPLIRELKFRKGENLAVLFLAPGGGENAFSCGEITAPCEDAAFRKALADHWFPRRCDLRTEPFLTFLKDGCFAVSVQLYNAGLVRIRYRAIGEKEFRTAQNSKDGLFDNAPFQNVILPELKPGSYEYFTDVSCDYREYKSSGPRKFTIPDMRKTKYSLLFISDTQFFASDLDRMFGQLVRDKAFSNIDMIVHLGDLQHRCDDYENMIADIFFRSYVQHTRGALPFMAIRGNHEFNGEPAAQYITRFGKGYGFMQMGEVFFLILDQGAAWKVRKELYDVQTLFAEESAWLEKVFQSDAWKNTKYRVVLAHQTPLMDGGKHYPDFIRKYFLGKKPQQKIDLWLCGHTHWAARFEPAQRQYLTYQRRTSGGRPPVDYRLLSHTDWAARQDLVPQKYPGKQWGGPARLRTAYKGNGQPIPFPVIVMDGGSSILQYSSIRLDADENGLHLVHRDMKNQVMDDLVLTPEKVLKIRASALKPVSEHNRKGLPPLPGGPACISQ